MYLAFDPGGTTGWAKFNDEGEVVESGQVNEDELHNKVEEWVIEHENDPIIAVICEGFIIFKHKASKFAGSRMETIQVIGIVKALARRVGAKYVEQDSSILPMAQKHTQVFLPKDHSKSHWVSAFNHGAEYLIRQGIRKSQLEREADGTM